MADIPDAGLSVVVTADTNISDGAKARDALLRYARDRRTEWFHRHHPLKDAVARAKTLTDGPVVLLDHADNVGSGGTSELLSWVVVLGAIGSKPGKNFGYTVHRDFKCGVGAVLWDMQANLPKARAAQGAH